MTDIVPTPAAPSVPIYPALGSPGFNAEAYAYGSAMPGVSTAIQSIADAAHTNATAAQEQAQAAAQERAEAVAETGAIKTAAVAETGAIKTAAVAETTAIKTAAVAETVVIRDQAMGYRDAAALSALAAQGSANFRGEWSALTGAIAMPATVRHAGKFWVLLANLGDVTAAEPGVSPAWAKTSAGAPLIAYTNRAQLRSTTGATGDQAVIDGLGLFVYAESSDEPDDDESCFATATGRWLLQCPHWDVVDTWQLPDDDARDAWDEDEPLRFASSFASKVLRGTATCAITSVSAQSSASFTGTVQGAALGDSVIATPPAQLGDTVASTGYLAYHAYVSAANTVTVTLTAAYNAANTNPAVRTAWPITVIKGA